MNITLKKLKELYETRENDEGTVRCGELVFDIGYLKYLIEYLELCKATPATNVELSPHTTWRKKC